MSAHTARGKLHAGESQGGRLEGKIFAEVSPTLPAEYCAWWANLTDIETGAQVMSTAAPNVELLRSRITTSMQY